MHQRAEELITILRLQPHEEGGHFAEIFRSRHRVRPVDPPAGPPDRSALTTIYFLLAAGEVSRWHRLDADETWHFYEGEPLELFLLDGKAQILSRLRLGPRGSGTAPVHVVPAHSWLAARPAGAYALVGCTMGPGFEAAGFTLMSDEPAAADEVRRRFPDLAGLL